MTRKKKNLLGLDQLLATSSSPGRLIADFLDILIAEQGIDAAWIGRPNDEGLLLPEAARGLEMKVLNENEWMINIQSGPRSNGPCGHAWRSKRVIISDDVNVDSSLTPWQEEWRLLGLRVVAAIPLIGAHKVHRILTIYSTKIDFFRTTWKIASLTRLGKIIGLALESRDNVKALLHSKRLLETLFISAETLFCTNTEEELLNNICERLSSSGLFICSAIGKVDCDGMFSYQIASGPDAEGVRKLRQSITDMGPQQLLGIRAWRTNEIQTADGYATLSRLAAWRQIAHRGGWTSAAAAVIQRNGENFAVLFLISSEINSIDTETKRLIQQLVRDIGRALEEIDLKQKLSHDRKTQEKIARQDRLTNLPNRLAFEELLPVALEHAKRYGSEIGIGIFDLDNFKPINDQYGHSAGDQVLKIIGKRLAATLRDVDFIARLGGDEFVIIIGDISLLSDLVKFLDRLNNTIKSPILLENGIKIILEASLGLTQYPTDHGSPETLIINADLALYAIKAEKGRRSKYWMTYQELTNSRLTQKTGQILLGNGCLEVHYQPIIAVNNGAIVGIEALARLRDSQNLLLPGQFLPDFSSEEREVLFSMVLKEGISTLLSLTETAPYTFLSINVDAEVLERGAIPDIISNLLKNTTIMPDRITLELLESHEFSSFNTALTKLNDVRNCGVRIAIDDVGVDFSTFKRVLRLPIDSMKIDKSFLVNIKKNPNDLIILLNCIQAAKMTGISVCVEGVESTEILEALRFLDAPMAQGFNICRPLPAIDLAFWITENNPIQTNGTPECLLGAYASYIHWTQKYLLIKCKKLFQEFCSESPVSSLENLLRKKNLINTQLGDTYYKLMFMIKESELDFFLIKKVLERFRILLSEAVSIDG